MNVQIIGLYHRLQWTKLDPQVADDQERYREMVRAEIGSCLAVLEEAGEYEHLSFAKPLTNNGGPSYRNIDIPPSARCSIHYKPDEEHLDMIDNRDNIYARSWNLVREWHMIHEINGVVNAHLNVPDGKILVICGLLHVEAIKTHLPRDVKTVGGGLFYTMAR